MKNRKGFTLVELLVVIVILGIITGLSIPLIRNLSASMEKKKYTTYNETLLSGAKLYNDSYSEDLFGHNENGCAYVTYAQLKERNLLKDIEISDVSCDSDSTFVRILKVGDKYSYSPFLGCGKKKNGKANSIDTSLPEPNKVYEMNSEYCTGTEENNLEISALIGSDANSMNKKRKKTKLTITSATGINNKMSLSVKWSTNKNDHDGTFEKVDFKVPGDQKEKMLNGEIISTTSNELITPAGKTGEYYLIVKVDLLQDLYGSKWSNKKDNSKYISFGPFVIDNEPPTVPVITAYVKTSATNITSEGKLSTIKTDKWSNKWIFTKPKSTDNSGKTITYYYTTTGKTTNNTDTKGSYRNINDEGKSNIKYKACDVAGNCSEYSADFIIKLDRTKPKCEKASGASTTWTNQNRTIKQACSDTLSGCEKASYDTTYSTTTKTSSVKIKDKVGHEVTCNYNVYVDKTKPTKPSISNPTNGNWTKSNFSLTLGSTDAHSGINYYQYTYAANATTTGNNHDKTWVTYSNSKKTSFTTTAFSAERNQYVYVRSCDVAGNCSDKNQTYIRIDKTAPTCTAVAKLDSLNGSNYSQGSLTCSAVYTQAVCADSGSGCSNTNSLTTTGATTNVTNDTTHTFWDVQARGTSYVTWKVYDKANNSTTCSKITVKKGANSADSSCGCKTYAYCQHSDCGTTTKYKRIYRNIWILQGYCQERTTANGYYWYATSPGTHNTTVCTNAIGNYTGQGCCEYYRDVPYEITNSCRTSACGCAEYKTCCR